MKSKHFLLAITGLTFLVASCSPAYYSSQDETKKLRLGTIQKELPLGSTQDKVATALGSPNIVTTNKGNKEVWIYDKISTETRKSGSSGLLQTLFTGEDYVRWSEINQKTLTVVITFDDKKQIEKISYHASKF